MAYSEDLNQALNVIDQALKQCVSVKQSEEIQVFPQAFGSSSIDIEVTWWTDPLPADLRRSREDVLTSIKRALDDAGIEIPFPYRTLTFTEALKTHDIGQGSEHNGYEIEQAAGQPHRYLRIQHRTTDVTRITPLVEPPRHSGR